MLKSEYSTNTHTHPSSFCSPSPLTVSCYSSAHCEVIGQSVDFQELLNLYSTVDYNVTLQAGLGFEFEPGIEQGENGQNGRSETARPYEPRAGLIEAQFVQRDEDITQVLERVQQERRVAAEDGGQQTQLLLKPGLKYGRAGGRGGGEFTVL